MGMIGNAPYAGVIDTGNILDGAITAAKIKAAADLVAKLGYTPVDKAGDTLSGNLTLSGSLLKTRVTDGTGYLSMGQWDAATNRVESSGKDLLMIQYGSTLKMRFQHASVGDFLVGDSAGRVLMPFQPGFSYGGGAGETVYTTGSALMSSYTSLVFNQGSHYNPATARFTAPVAGKYLFTATAWHQQASTLQAAMGFFLNGVQYDEVRSTTYNNGSGKYEKVVLTSIIPMQANEYVELKTTSFNAEIMVASGQYNKFSGYLLG